MRIVGQSLKRLINNETIAGVVFEFVHACHTYVKLIIPCNCEIIKPNQQIQCYI